MKRAFKVKQKASFINCKGLSVVKNCLRPLSAPLTLAQATSKKDWKNNMIQNNKVIFHHSFN